MSKAEQKAERLQTTPSVGYECSLQVSNLLIKNTALLNGAIDSLTDLSIWAQLKRTNLRIDPTVAIQQLASEYNTFRDVIDAIHGTMWNILGDNSYSPTGIPEITQTLVKHYAHLPINKILLTNDEEAKAAARAIAIGCHDLHGFAGLFWDAAKSYDKEPKRVVRDLYEDLARVKKLVSNVQQELQESYPKDRIPLYGVMYQAEALFLHYLPDCNTSVNRDGWFNSPLKCIWSEAWCDTLLMNLIQNVKRAKAKNIVIFVKQSKDNNGKWIHIFFDDDGVNPDAYIVKNGFETGVTRFGGEGEGMAHQSKIIKKYYGGDLTLEYRTDSEENRIPGARVHLRLPIAH